MFMATTLETIRYEEEKNKKENKKLEKKRIDYYHYLKRNCLLNLFWN